MGEVESNDQNAEVPERAHGRPAEGGHEASDEVAGSTPDGDTDGSEVPDPEQAGIVDQQGAALRDMQPES
jgi:hypothetical protein